MYFTNLERNPEYQFYFNPPKLIPKGDTADQIRAYGKAIDNARHESEVKFKRIGHNGIYETLIGNNINPDSIRNAITMDYEDALKILSIKNAQIV